MDQRGKAIPAADRAMGGMGLGALSGHDATIKFLVASLPVWQVLFVRSSIIVIASLAIGRTKLIERAVRTPLKLALLGRGVLTLVAWLCYYTASRSLPLAQMTTLYFAAPLIVTVLAAPVLAAPVLGEVVTRARWIAVSVGFVGVMIASDPLGVSLSLPTALVLAAACMWGYGVLLMRQIARRESSLLQILSNNSVFVIGTGAMSLAYWQPPSAAQAGLLLMVAVLGGLGQLALFEGARRVPASVMATVEYSGLLWAFILGYLIFGDIPKTAVFVGAALIVCAGVLLIGSERRAARRGVAVARVR
jgi:drug/metabolite transporter (DMT)-like permease